MNKQYRKEKFEKILMTEKEVDGIVMYLNAKNERIFKSGNGLILEDCYIYDFHITTVPNARSYYVWADTLEKCDE